MRALHSALRHFDSISGIYPSRSPELEREATPLPPSEPEPSPNQYVPSSVEALRVKLVPTPASIFGSPIRRIHSRIVDFDTEAHSLVHERKCLRSTVA